jgi:tRNA(Arg) A34 adenosine deaminase TadA
MHEHASERDIALLREVIALSEKSKRDGRHPFAALIADENGHVLASAGNNSMPPLGDPTQHAELRALHECRAVLHVLGRDLLVQHRARGLCHVRAALA